MNILDLCPTDVHCGRQDEIDISKGLFIFPILPIHAFQMLGNQAASASNAYQWLFGSFMPTGAGSFLFLMGFGPAYTNNALVIGYVRLRQRKRPARQQQPVSNGSKYNIKRKGAVDHERSLFA